MDNINKTSNTILFNIKMLTIKCIMFVKYYD